MIAKLVLTTGSHAGIEIPFKYGYYMIGRDEECQIRPSSHSVSRRHCLLHHSEHGLRVFDLASANGTHVNQERLEPNQWVWLRSDDKLRCGTLIFDVSVQLGSQRAGRTIATASLKAKDEADPPVIKQRAWEDFDIASFLEAEDEAERQERYASLKSQSDDDEQSRDESQSRSCEVTSIDLVQGDKKAQAVLEEARRKAAEQRDFRFSARAIRIAALRAGAGSRPRPSPCPHRSGGGSGAGPGSDRPASARGGALPSPRSDPARRRCRPRIPGPLCRSG